MNAQDASFHRWSDMPLERVTDHFERRLVSGERVMLAQIFLKRGCIVPMHVHEHEQITYVVQGALHFWIGADGAREQVVAAGEVLHLPSNLPHKATALEDTVVTDVFSPPRQDWLDKTDAYLRR